MSIAGIALAVAVGYIQELRVENARNEAYEELQVVIDNLTNELVEKIRQETNEDIEARLKSDDPCLSTPLPDELAERLRD